MCGCALGGSCGFALCYLPGWGSSFRCGRVLWLLPHLLWGLAGPSVLPMWAGTLQALSWPSLPDGLSWGGHHLGQPLSPVECGKLICVWIGETSMACGGGSSCPAHFHTVTSTQHLDTPKEAWSRPRAAASAVAMPLLGSARLPSLRWAEWEKEAGTHCPFRQGAVRIWPLLHACPRLGQVVQSACIHLCLGGQASPLQLTHGPVRPAIASAMAGGASHLQSGMRGEARSGPLPLCSLGAWALGSGPPT